MYSPIGSQGKMQQKEILSASRCEEFDIENIPQFSTFQLSSVAERDLSCSSLVELVVKHVLIPRQDESARRDCR